MVETAIDSVEKKSTYSVTFANIMQKEFLNSRKYSPGGLEQVLCIRRGYLHPWVAVACGQCLLEQGDT